MFIIDITEELKLDSYKRFIDYAISKSDAFMLVTERVTDIEAKYAEAFENLDEDSRLEMKKYYEETKQRLYKNKAMFEKNAEPFLEKIQPYLVKTRNYPTEWAGRIVAGNDKYIKFDISVYRICKEVKPYLLEPKGLFNWRDPYFPEDLSFFKDGYSWFHTVAHDGYGIMYTESDDDIEKLKEMDIEFEIRDTSNIKGGIVKSEEMGIEFNVIDSNSTKEDLFYEEYEL